MPQKIHTKNFGDLTFERTWAISNDMHIGRLVNGAYAHIGGLPVMSREELMRAIPHGPEQEAALDWFDNRDRRAAEARIAPARLVYFYAPDKSWRYIDTQQPVDSVEHLYEALKGSAALNEAVGWFVAQQRQASPQSGAVADEPGLGVDERILRMLGEAQTEGKTAHEIAQALRIDPPALIPILKSMVEGSRISRQGSKRFVLPAYADEAAVGAVETEE